MQSSRALDLLTSPLSEHKGNELNHLVEGLSREQISWISGYLSGINAAGGQPAAVAEVQSAANAQALPEITIVYGSQTGNAEKVVDIAREQAEARGFAVNAVAMGDFKKPHFRKSSNLMVVCSTHGEGDPPDDAIEMHELVHGRKAPKLAGTRFSVLALGDTSYEHFCKAGRDFDARLQALGGERVSPRVDCDVDFEDPARQWVDAALEAFSQQLQMNAGARASDGAAADPKAVVYDRKNPFQAVVLEDLVLNGRGSDKEVHHIELSLEDSGLMFEPGDSLGIIAPNAPREVGEILAALDMAADTVVEIGGEPLSLEQALTDRLEITTLTRPVLEKYAEHGGDETLRGLLQPEQRQPLRTFLYEHHLIDLLRQYPVASWQADQFVAMLRKLPTRVYSIASSHRTNPDEVHLTVAAVRYDLHERRREGVASIHLSDRIAPGETVGVYVDRNKNFRLPDDGSAPVIMVGPGTGVAPFRAFMEEREFSGGGGSNWLFFGDRHFHTDFLYQTDWQRYYRDGLLNRIDLAWSRDHEQKVYVQDRMREQAADLYRWLEDGAYVYVCGDAERMAGDVHDALHDIVREQGGISQQGAADYVKSLQKSKRYQRDVY